MESSLTTINVKSLTEAAIILASEKFDLRNQLDNDMFNHVIYVTNQVLLLAKRDGIGEESLTKMGKYIWRLINVIQAYNSKKRDVTLEELANIVLDFKDVFLG